MKHKRFCIVYNNDTEKRILWENYIPLDCRAESIKEPFWRNMSFWEKFELICRS